MVDPNISDEQWFEINLNPEKGTPLLGFSLPSLPPENIQRGFAGATGKSNLQRAFSFYQHLRDNYLDGVNPVIMDFGSGWGRIARFFLRDTIPENIFAVDPYSLAVKWMAETNLPCQIIHSNPLPPIPNLNQKKFDLIYAHSVFSHLTEDYFRSWIHYLLSLLKDDGFVVFTTQGTSVINHIEKNKIKQDIFQDYAKLRERYDRGEFLFFRNRDSSRELSGDFFGQAFIPQQYLEKELPNNFLSFTESVPGVAQAVVVLKRVDAERGKVDIANLPESEREELISSHPKNSQLWGAWQPKAAPISSRRRSK